MKIVLLIRLNSTAPQNGDTPLHYAAWSGQTECATFLMEAGVRTDIENKVRLQDPLPSVRFPFVPLRITQGWISHISRHLRNLSGSSRFK